ncbi:hypothetical protein MRB53_023401 [Persea americana]|uniref:Uncharacterized protein n=1 Tax=Persea americana TaxID=3435 RepID=A0ACC2LAA2_PERAE|nr:hypothetical protein MRB53_023401 [Persea americana]
MLNMDAEQLQHPPPDISGEDWAWLVQYWGRAEVKAIAKKNKANQSRQVITHTGGTKSFARYRDEETRVRTDGRIPSRADLFLRTHTRKDETPVDSRSAEIIVMGAERHDRVRGYGLGPMPRSVFGSKPGQSGTNVEEMLVELNVVHNRMEDLMKRDEDRNAYLEELQREQQRMRIAMVDMMRQLSDQQQSSFEEIARGTRRRSEVSINDAKSRISFL